MRAVTFSAKDLSPMLDKAVAAARDKHNVSLDGHNTLFINWELVGRRLKDIDMKSAEAFATEVANGISAGGHKVEPVVIRLPKGGILAGWFPIERISELQF